VVLGLRCHARRQARRRARTTRGARGTTRWDGSPRPVGRRGPVGAEGTFLSRRAHRSLGHSPLPRSSRLPSPPFLLPLTPSSPVSFLPFGSSTHNRESTPRLVWRQPHNSETSGLRGPQRHSASRRCDRNETTPACHAPRPDVPACLGWKLPPGSEPNSTPWLQQWVTHWLQQWAQQWVRVDIRKRKSCNAERGPRPTPSQANATVALTDLVPPQPSNSSAPSAATFVTSLLPLNPLFRRGISTPE
jgi:hypothetical protein